MLMPVENPLRTHLVDVDDSLLVVIDVQDHFLAKLPAVTVHQLLSRISWLVHLAVILDVPVVVTAEDISNVGPVAAPVTAALPGETVVYDKMSFNVAAQPDILAAAEATGRRTAVLVGLETDVCVAQSALGLMGEGFRAAVVADAVASPGQGHANGLARMRAAGVLVSDVKSLYYEWVRTVRRDQQVRREINGRSDPPQGIRF